MTKRLKRNDGRKGDAERGKRKKRMRYFQRRLKIRGL
jgi:hypothetical protein